MNIFGMIGRAVHDLNEQEEIIRGKGTFRQHEAKGCPTDFHRTAVAVCAGDFDGNETD